MKTKPRRNSEKLGTLKLDLKVNTAAFERKLDQLEARVRRLKREFAGIPVRK